MVGITVPLYVYQVKRECRQKEVDEQKHWSLQGFGAQQLPGVTKVKSERSDAQEGMARGQPGQAGSGCEDV